MLDSFQDDGNEEISHLVMLFFRCMGDPLFDLVNDVFDLPIKSWRSVFKSRYYI